MELSYLKNADCKNKCIFNAVDMTYNNLNNIKRKDMFLKEYIYDKQIHSFIKYPWLHWILSLILLISAIILLYINVINRYTLKLDNKFKFFSIAFNVLIFYIPFVIIYMVNIEYVTIDKKKGIISRTTKNMFFKQNKQIYYINKLIDIDIILKGFVSRSKNTSKYYIRMKFNDKYYYDKLANQTNKKFIRDETKILEFGETSLVYLIEQKYKICVSMLKGIIIESFNNNLITNETYSDIKSYEDF